MNQKKEAYGRKNNDRSRAPRGFFSGVLVLSASTLLVKIIGLAYKIPMIDRLGAVGMGYFNSAYEIFAILCVIATSGLPMAVSLLIAAHREAERKSAIRRTFGVALLLFLIMGTVGGAVLFFGADPIARTIGNPDAALCMRAIAPALPTVCFCGAIRGYFQGYQRMGPTALSQLIEALGKLIFGVGFASMALNRGLSTAYVAAAAIWGVTLGTIISALYLLIMKLSHRSAKSQEKDQHSEAVLKNLLRIAIPITVGSVLLSLTRILDMTLMMHRLQSIGYSVTETNAIYGSYTTLAVPIFSLIPSLITPIALVLVPKLSAAIERKDQDMQGILSENSIRMTVILSMPAALGIASFSGSILSVLFSEEEAAIALATPMLSILGGSVLFSGIITATNAILQAYRHTMLPVLSLVVGVAVKGISEYFLLGLPEIGAYGAPISTLICDACVSILNIFFIGKYTQRGTIRVGYYQMFGKPLISASVAVFSAMILYYQMTRIYESVAVPLFCAIGMAALVYGVLILWTKTITQSDLALFFGNKQIRFFYLKKERNTENGNDSG